TQAFCAHSSLACVSFSDYTLVIPTRFSMSLLTFSVILLFTSFAQIYGVHSIPASEEIKNLFDDPTDQGTAMFVSGLLSFSAISDKRFVQSDLATSKSQKNCSEDQVNLIMSQCMQQAEAKWKVKVPPLPENFTSTDQLVVPANNSKNFCYALYHIAHCVMQHTCQ